MLEIDGSAFSGSGMIVRHAVAYAACTATPIHVHDVRARRPRPGLRAQHHCAVEAVRALVGGRLDGAAIGSRELTFVPGGASPRGDYRFDVGTAGSVTALSLAVLPVLATAAGPVRVELVGGLFQDSAPSAFHLQHKGAAAARQLLADLRTGATLDRYVSDQVLVFAGGQTRVRPAAWTDHVRSGRWLAGLNGATSRTEEGLLIVEGTGRLG